MIARFLFLTSVVLLNYSGFCLAQIRGRHASSSNQQQQHTKHFSSLFLESLDKIKTEPDSLQERRLARMKLTAIHLFGVLNGGHCQHLYVDLGTNTGMQIRKLFEPHKYPDAPIHESYNKYFGPFTQRRGVCAIGIEANPLHSRRLHQLQGYYQANGFPLHIFHETIVSTKFVLDIPFYLEENTIDTSHGWGSTAAAPLGSHTITVPSIDIAALLSDILQIWTSSVGMKGSNPRSFMVKMDVEGSEVIILPHLMLHGILCQINFLSIEWHPHIKNIGDEERNATKKLFHSLEDEKVYGCGFKMVEFDDETYFLGEDPNSIEPF